MPKIGPLHEKLAMLTGRWEGEEQVASNPWVAGGPARARVTFRRDVNGFFLIQDYVQEREGKESFSGHGVFGVDPADGSVVYFWFDSLGFPPLDVARGSWSGDTLAVVKTTPRGQGRYTFSLEGETYRYRAESCLHGQSEFALVVEGTYRRVV